MPSLIREQIDDSDRCWIFTFSLFRINRQRLHLFSLHRQTLFAFYECIKQKHDEVHEHHGLDAMGEF